MRKVVLELVGSVQVRGQGECGSSVDIESTPRGNLQSFSPCRTLTYSELYYVYVYR